MPQLYKISKQAEEDWRNIINYTLNKFGEHQVQEYTKSLINCLNELADRKGYFKKIIISSYSVMVKHCQKHYIFAYDQQDGPLLIIAILHERMDLIQRLKNRLK